LKRRVIQKQLFQWFQEDPSLEPLYTEYWNIWDQLLHSENGRKPASAAVGPKPKREAPGAKENEDGVIEIDDDGEVQAVFEAETELALKMSLGGKVPELSENRKRRAADHEDGDKKPAASHKRAKADPSGVTQHTDGIIEIDHDDDIPAATEGSKGGDAHEQEEEEDSKPAAADSAAESSDEVDEDGSSESNENAREARVPAPNAVAAYAEVVDLT
jgi:hypothetical protein